jgi:hypothetical protein
MAWMCSGVTASVGKVVVSNGLQDYNGQPLPPARASPPLARIAASSSRFCPSRTWSLAARSGRAPWTSGKRERVQPIVAGGDRESENLPM